MGIMTYLMLFLPVLDILDILDNNINLPFLLEQNHVAGPVYLL